MIKQTKHIIYIFLITFSLTGCGVSSIVALPFKVTGAVVNVVTPKIVGNTIAGTGEVIEDTVPF